MEMRADETCGEPASAASSRLAGSGPPDSGDARLADSGTTPLYDAMDAARRYGRWVRQDPAVDGRAAWQPVKAWATGRGVPGVWHAPHVRAADEPDPRPGLAAAERGGDEGAHFEFQLYDIPASEPCDLRRALQVAYNLGQGDSWGRWGVGGPGALGKNETYIKSEVAAAMLTEADGRELWDLIVAEIRAGDAARAAKAGAESRS